MRTVLGIHSHGYPNLFIMGGLPGLVPLQPDRRVAACKAITSRPVSATRAATAIKAMNDVTEAAEDWWVGEVISNRGKTTRVRRTARRGTTTSKGETQRRQDGNYNGSYPKYIAHTKSVSDRPAEYFAFSDR